MVVPALSEAQANPNQIAILRWYEGNEAGNYFTVGDSPRAVAFDGANVWVASFWGGTVTKLRATDGSVIGTYVVGNPAVGYQPPPPRMGNRKAPERWRPTVPTSGW